jgi:hypothetical protein
MAETLNDLEHQIRCGMTPDPVVAIHKSMLRSLDQLINRIGIPHNSNSILRNNNCSALVARIKVEYISFEFSDMRDLDCQTYTFMKYILFQWLEYSSGEFTLDYDDFLKVIETQETCFEYRRP